MLDKRRLEEAMIAAYTGAALGRAKKMPSMKKVLEPLRQGDIDRKPVSLKAMKAKLAAKPKFQRREEQ